MKILLSIIINSGILFLMTYLLAADPNKGIAAGIIVTGGWQTYLIGGIVLGVMNITIRPVLKLLSLPFFLLFFGLVVFVINAIILKLFDYIINTVLIIPGVSYTINGNVNFIIAVAIFTILNMLYSLLFSKS